MKKLIVFAAICCLCLTSNAQLKVDSLGKIHIQNSSSANCKAKLIVGDNPGEYWLSNYYWFHSGIYSQNFRTNSDKDFVGVYGGVELTGEPGEQNAYSCNYGVVGVIPIGARGAGVVGIDEGTVPPYGYVQGSYAGYFFGNTYVEGDLSVAYGFYNLSDMRLKDNVTSLRHGTLSALQGLDVFEYTLKRPNLMAAIKEGKVSDRMKKNLERPHYGVSAQELQKVYPNLVKEGQDGYLTVNYVEMVPLLLRCIQELKQESDSLKQEVEELKAMYDVLGGKSPIADGK